MTKTEKYELKMEVFRVKIRTLLDSGKAKLSPSLFQLLHMTKQPRDSILEYIQSPGLKLMDLERTLQTLCPHSEPRVQAGESAMCPSCRDYLGGWWCPISPDHSCYYNSSDNNGIRVVHLESGTMVSLPKEHDHQYETNDSCLFCHQPDERK